MPSLVGGDFLLEGAQHLLTSEPESLPLHEVRRTDQQHQRFSKISLENQSLNSRNSHDYTQQTLFGGNLSSSEDTPEKEPLVSRGAGSEEEDEEEEEEDDDSGMPRRQPSRIRTSKDVAASSSATDTPSKPTTNGHTKEDSMNGNSIEMRRKKPSLDAEQRTMLLTQQDGFSLDHEPPPTPGMAPVANASFFELPRKDQRNFMLLVLLYFLQGVPMGLAGGSVPFLLKSYLSYTQIGVFTLASYPYSLKLFWSPIVDAVWSPKIGRRKSWILPIQTLSGFGMLYLGSQAERMMHDASKDDGAGIWVFTAWWFGVVFMCATQDIAVDGWALTLLSPENLSYASTAQTVGLTAGQFMSFTVFLAFNSADFANKWFRKVPSDVGLMTLGGYLTFWGFAYLVVTVGLAILKREEKTKERDGIMEVYRSMWGIVKLRDIQTILIVHLIAKIGFQANDSATNLKLLDSGFSQEDLALTVLIDFPFEVSLGYYVGTWSNKYQPMNVWCVAFMARLVAAIFAQITVMVFPPGGSTNWYLFLVIIEHIYSTFCNTAMFVAISAFHARIADPTIGGTYMTLLATVSNLGGTFPRFFVLKLIDMFTKATCHPFVADHPGQTPDGLKEGTPLVTSPFSCALEADKHRCLDGGGTCEILRDGYYYTNVICVIVGTITFFLYIQPAVKRLQTLPLRAWRLKDDGR